MFPFLAIFIIFCVILSYYIRKGNASQEKIQEDFWEKERLANNVRKKDISKLNYITIPLEKIPQKIYTSTEENFFALAEKPILNLTGISNTDLKLQYGTANFTALAEYDENFAQLVSLLPEYTAELEEAGEISAAQALLEFAIEVGADSRKVHTQLENLKQNSSTMN